jgi:hypothetical protein
MRGRKASTLSTVMRGLDPRIHLKSKGFLELMDCRVRPGNDERGCSFDGFR